MEFKKDIDFDNYVEKYKMLSLKDKIKVIEYQIDELIVVLDSLNTKFGSTENILFNREILDIKKENFSEDDFAEAVFVYIYSIKELIGTLVEKMGK